MRYEITYKELAELFNSIAKAEEALMQYKASRTIYEAVDNDWYKNGCNSDEADDVLRAYAVQTSDEKKVEKALKKASSYLSLDYKEWREVRIIEDLKSGSYKFDSALYGIKEMAKGMVAYIKDVIE